MGRNKISGLVHSVRLDLRRVAAGRSIGGAESYRAPPSLTSHAAPSDGEAPPQRRSHPHQVSPANPPLRSQSPPPAQPRRPQLRPPPLLLNVHVAYSFSDILVFAAQLHLYFDSQQKLESTCALIRKKQKLSEF